MSEPVRSFCSRVINLCYSIEDLETASPTLKDAAVRVRHEAEGVQDVYGGRKKPSIR